MKRRGFIEALALGTGLSLSSSSVASGFGLVPHAEADQYEGQELKADLVIVGAGLGGFAAALAALRNGETVVLTEETDWIGGQLTQQGVPPDEHQWIETHGAPVSYRNFRNAVRSYYKAYYPLTAEAKSRENLNPGDGAVSRLCHEPKVALAIMESWLQPYISSGRLTLLLNYFPFRANVSGNQVEEVSVKHGKTGQIIALRSKYFVDATELGDLLPLTKTEYRTGTESKAEFNELHAPEQADNLDNQSFTVCFAMDYVPGENHTIPKPKDYDFWKNYIPNIKPAWSGKLLSLSYSNPQTLEPKTLGFHPEGKSTGDQLNLWNYRRIIHKHNFDKGVYAGDITIVNWPQNDYMLGNLIDVPRKEFDKHVAAAKQLSLSLLYWLQTEVENEEGGKGWPGIRLRKDIMGTEDGMAKYPYIRESRRIKAEFTVTEQHVGKENRKISAQANEDSERAVNFEDSVGIGYYHIDLHPTQRRNYVDFPSLPFQIPLGALIPIRMDNLLPANKNIGTTHITNGCYRLHPVEWSIGEAVGLLVNFAKKKAVTPRQVRSDKTLLREFQDFIRSQGVETEWK
ncbi:FAD-dependent oxidoreductase [Sphingobacterium cellulitidis]|uniref:FAD-dependent oxidoreductase n=1 Tax=Sphingobacterium cellulitidis TaxID=1768011 RepID=UPI00370DB061